MHISRYWLTLLVLSASGMLLELAAYRQWRLYLRMDSLHVILPMVMVGMAAGAILLHVIKKRTGAYHLGQTPSGHPDIISYLLITYAAISLLPYLLLALTSRTSSSASSLLFTGGSIAGLFLLFVIWGYVNADFFGRCPKKIFSLYTGNLLGTMIGAAAGVVLMDQYGAPATIIFGAGAAIITVWTWYVADPGQKAGAKLWRTCLALTMCALLFLISPVNLTILHGEESPVWFGSNSYSQLEMYPIKPVEVLRGRGPLAVPPEETGLRAWRVYFDRLEFNYTNIIRYDNLNDVEFLANGLSSLAFLAGIPGRALVLGAGGGIEVIQGLLAGYRHIDAVEINPLVPEALQHVKAARFINDNRVSYHLDDARRFAIRDYPEFDLVFMPHVRGQEVGGVISTKYLNTVELINRFMDNLARNGTFVIRSHKRDRPSLLATINAALNKRDPTDKWTIHLAAEKKLRRGYSLILLHRGAFSPLQERRIREFIDANGFSWFRLDRNSAGGGTVLTEDHPYPTDIKKFIRSGKISTSKRPLGVSGSFPMLYRLAIPVCTALALILSLVSIQSTLSRTNIRGLLVSGGVYLSFLGCGFMATEIVFIEKMFFVTGNPTASIGVTISSLLGGALLGNWLLRNQSVTRLLAILPKISFGGAFLLVIVFFLLERIAVVQGTPDMVRLCLAALLIFLPGGFIGVLFPAGILLLAEKEQQSIPWSWAINGIAAIIGGISAHFLAITYGYRMALLFSAACYFSAALLSWRLAGQMIAGRR